MKFVIDQQLPPALVTWLEAKGHKVEHVFFIRLGEAEDSAIWNWASQQTAIVVTKDVDFADRRQRDHTGPTIVWLRIGNSTTPALLAWLESAWSRVESALDDGLAVVEVR